MLSNVPKRLYIWMKASVYLRYCGSPYIMCIAFYLLLSLASGI